MSSRFAEAVDELKKIPQLGEKLQTVPPRDERIALLSVSGASCNFIAASYDVSNERILQILQRTLRRLRSPSRVKRLRDFMVP
jgi:DNA-directed RNA polymerase sigma subunit (sigma70/sigma32)